MKYLDFVTKILSKLWVSGKVYDPPLTYWNFDWDVNLVRMPSKIILFANTESDHQETLELSNEDWCVLRSEVGKQWSELPLTVRNKVTTHWHKFKIVPARSFIRFRSVPDANYFLEDLKEALKLLPEYWQGHSWQAFCLALSKEETAKRTSIISARGHEARDVFEGLEYLREFLYQVKGQQIYLPSIENLHMVGKLASPSEEKAKILMQQIRKIEKIPIRASTPMVLDANGIEFKQLHLVGFSDDDFENFSKMQATLSLAYKNRDIKNTKVTLFYTGGTEIKAIVMTSDGGTRSMIANEEREYTEYLNSMRPNK